MLAIDRSIALAATAVASVVGPVFSLLSGNKARRYSESMMQVQSPSRREK